MPASGCGYALAGRGSFLPTTFGSSGSRSSSTQTPSFRSSRSSPRRSGPSSSDAAGTPCPGFPGADAVRHRSRHLHHGAAGRIHRHQLASRYLFTLTMNVEFTDARTNEVLWANERPHLPRGVRAQQPQQYGPRRRVVPQSGAQLLRSHRRRRCPHGRDGDSRGVLGGAAARGLRDARRLTAIPRLTPSALRKQIAAGDTAPLYVLVGDDDDEKAAVAASSRTWWTKVCARSTSIASTAAR